MMASKSPHTEKKPPAKKPAFPTARPFIPEKPTLPAMASAVQACEGCDLYLNATQAVFGEGAAKAKCVFVGEQPGNEEDLQGHPFIGPAGRVLDRALEEAGIQRDQIYLTNAVKHFKNEQVGNRRKHKSPNTPEIKACRPWLEAELRVTRPRVIVCMGVTAARSVMGRTVTLKELRGQITPSEFSERTIVTMHPSAILRSPDDESRHRNYAAFVADLLLAKKAMQ